jgi:hypothetical protein
MSALKNVGGQGKDEKQKQKAPDCALALSGAFIAGIGVSNAAEGEKDRCGASIVLQRIVQFCRRRQQDLASFHLRRHGGFSWPGTAFAQDAGFHSRLWTRHYGRGPITHGINCTPIGNRVVPQVVVFSGRKYMRAMGLAYSNPTSPNPTSDSGIGAESQAASADGQGGSPAGRREPRLPTRVHGDAR